MNIIRDIYDHCKGSAMTTSASITNFRAVIRQLAKSVYFYSARPPVTRKEVEFSDVMNEIGKHRVVIFGEQHQQPQILKAQLCVMEGMASEREAKAKETGRRYSLSLVLEMFNFEQQKILDDFSMDMISVDDVVDLYKSSEGFDVENHYGHLLEAAKQLDIRVVAGFVPKTLCSRFVKDGKENDETIGHVDHFYIKGSEEHYRYFEALITGDSTAVTNKYRHIFPAQVLRDSSLAYKIKECIEESSDSQVIAICGSGHVDFHFGVPERIPSDVPVLVVTSRSTDDPIEDNVADFVYQYQSCDQGHGEHFEHP